MCYPPPGPRCSSHAHAEWLRAVAALDRETNPDRKIRLQLKADEAFRAFNATPRGQNRLIREMGALSGNPEENKDQLSKLSLQLRDGQLTRKNQMAAYHALKNSKKDSLKTLLNTSNKQEQAVGIAFHVLMDLLPEEEADKAHIVSSNLIQYRGTKILCLPLKHQREIGTYRVEENEYLSSVAFPNMVLDIIASFPEASMIAGKQATDITEWLIQGFIDEGVTVVAVVDVKTENLFLDRIENLLAHYDAAYLQKKRFGGTSPYLHGLTDLLKANLAGTALEPCEVTVATVKEQKRTYILDAPYLEPRERQTEAFYFAENLTAEGTRFYEARVRHQSSQYAVLVRLNRRQQVISRTDYSALKKFLLENLPAEEEKAGD